MGLPTVTTRLGFELFKRDFTWFKDWYFPEGFREGSEKLQAEKPIDEEHRLFHLENIEKELEELMSRGPGDEGVEGVEGVEGYVGDEDDTGDKNDEGDDVELACREGGREEDTERYQEMTILPGPGCLPRRGTHGARRILSSLCPAIHDQHLDGHLSAPSDFPGTHHPLPWYGSV